jgi:hypothetical protein
MLPDLRLVIVAVAVTILVVIKFGADLASMLSDPYVEAPGRRLANQHMLPENPNHRQQLQTLAAARRVDELHRLLDLPTGTVTTFIDTTAGGGNIGGPFVGAGGTAQRSNRVRAAQPTRDNSSDVVPHAARSADATRLAMTASPSPARTAAIADQRDRLAPSESQAAPAAPAPPPGSAAAAPDAAVASEDDTRRVAAVSPPDQTDDLVTPTDIPLLKRVPMPRARTGIHAAAIHARARRLVARKPTLPDNPFAVLFGMGAAGN